MARRLSTIAREINEILVGFTAQIVRGYCNTDTKISGTRLRREGKGREGNRIIVRNSKGKVVLDHNAAETYRQNEEVERWLEKVKQCVGHTGSSFRDQCPHCSLELKSGMGDHPFGHCPKCKSTFLMSDAHY